jgi:hypothetical protein
MSPQAVPLVIDPEAKSQEVCVCVCARARVCVCVCQNVTRAKSQEVILFFLKKMRVDAKTIRLTL